MTRTLAEKTLHEAGMDVCLDAVNLDPDDLAERDT